jgi:hypothetical protein
MQETIICFKLHPIQHWGYENLQYMCKHSLFSYIRKFLRNVNWLAVAPLKMYVSMNNLNMYIKLGCQMTHLKLKLLRKKKKKMYAFLP